MSKNIKTLLINLIVICFFCNPIFASEIELLGVKLYDDLKLFEEINKIKSNKSEKCIKKYCNYKYKYKLNKPKYFTNYQVITNNKNKIISISGIMFDKYSLDTPKRFLKFYEGFKKTYCENELSGGVDYLSGKYKVNKDKFVQIFSEGKSNNPSEYENVLFFQSKLYMDSGNKIFELNCKYSRSDDSKWIISVFTTKLMTKDFHNAFEKHYKKKKINKFDANEIVSYLFPSSY